MNANTEINNDVGRISAAHPPIAQVDALHPRLSFGTLQLLAGQLILAEADQTLVLSCQGINYTLPGFLSHTFGVHSK